METQLLKEQDVYPTDEVLEKALGDNYQAYKKLMTAITDVRYGLLPVWNYYKDGKAWLCKVAYKKKTVFWLSVWDKCFKTGFYFTEKTSPGISVLDIDEKIKDNFSSSKNIGRLIPLVINVDSEEKIKDVIRIIEYKKSLK